MLEFECVLCHSSLIIVWYVFFIELLECDTMGEVRHRSIILECLSFSPSYSLSLLFRAVTASVFMETDHGSSY